MKNVTRYEMLKTIINGNPDMAICLSFIGDKVFLVSWLERHGDNQDLDIADMQFEVFDDEMTSDLFDIPGRNCGGMYYCDYEGSMPDEDIILNFVCDRHCSGDMAYVVTDNIQISEIKKEFGQLYSDVIIYLENNNN